MVDIAERFPPNSRTKYREAARQFRLPFWDYFRPRGRHSTYPTIRDEKNPNLFDFDFAVPTAITIEKLMIRTPEKDELTLVDNPLCFSYFPEEASAVRIQQNDWDETLQEEVIDRRIASINALLTLNRKRRTLDRGHTAILPQQAQMVIAFA